ncbi:MAG: hypothetical protein H4O13_00420 [Xanthomonadales bacterium]|nr:hypothetical protein [Xanthomonadales bacterium]
MAEPASSFLGPSARRHAAWATGLCMASIALYLSQPSSLPPNGGSWQGYVLGSLGALLILWLALLGLRKRRYRSTLGSMQGWVAAHVMFGLALVVVATLHSAFQLGWNVHSLAYVLMCVVIASGVYGLYAYLRLPRRLAEVHAGRRREDWLTALNRIDDEMRRVAQQADATTLAVVESAIDRTTLGGGVLAQVLGRDHSRMLDPSAQPAGSRTCANRFQQPLLDYLAARVPQARKRDEAAALQGLLGLAAQRARALAVLRVSVALQARLQLWLYLHIPLTIGLIAALLVHILVVFLYW